MKYLVEAREEFKGVLDNERKVYPKVGDQWEVDKERMEVLTGKNKNKKQYVEVIEIIETFDEEIETAVKEVKQETAKKTTTRKKTTKATK